MENITWLVSYPRSGNTWLRFLLANILFPDEDVNHISLDRLIPDIREKKQWEKLGVKNPLFIKSHDVWVDEFAEDKVIYMYRDVRDVALSYYHFSQGEWDIKFKGTFDDYLEKRFIPGGRYGGWYGRWDSHLIFWFDIIKDKVKGVESLFVKYEELWQYPYEEMRKIIEFLKIKVRNATDIQTAIDKSAFSELGKIRARDGVHLKKMGLTGRPGGWRETLTETQKELLWKEFGKTMKKLGYDRE